MAYLPATSHVEWFKSKCASGQVLFMRYCSILIVDCICKAYSTFWVVAHESAVYHFVPSAINICWHLLIFKDSWSVDRVWSVKLNHKSEASIITQIYATHGMLYLLLDMMVAKLCAFKYPGYSALYSWKPCMRAIRGLTDDWQNA